MIGFKRIFVIEQVLYLRKISIAITLIKSVKLRSTKMHEKILDDDLVNPGGRPTLTGRSTSTVPLHFF